MHEYLVRPEVVRVALVVGVVISMLFYERVQLTTGGAIVPAYLALHLAAPLFIVTTIVGAYLTYVVVNVVLARRAILYGRRKFEIEVLVGLGVIMVATIVAGRLGALDPILFGLAGIGFLVPGILAHDMARQRPGRTVLAVLATTAVLGVVVFVYDSLLAIAPLSPSTVPVLASVAGYDRDLLLVGVAVSVLIGMLVFAHVGVRSGGFITGAYLALLAPRWLDVLFTLVVAVATWAVVVHLLMPRLLIFGRRKLSTMVLVGAILAWSGELLVAWATGGDVLVWRGLTIMTLMAPALLANDAQRQGWEKTVWGAGLTALGVYGTMNLVSAGLKALGVA
ncbi:poly-gamma-glutamate biosynthesis protein PgsC/CapC [Actinomycetospora cinnamomea]|uniref:Poly-gamma-glutamate biosynthesis protein PgsC/CapC n=1 Tax=Actinomycetospora cinnamomea TaxID=663609 RepID=A0A2U1E8U4_9PSEU|nr:poly-gamma-glutamate biosynthesis protein PgsC/CapC [Actinomycetospora cinnamomea]PVY96363.1 poly-gamma-glutamate biosynthesis protein PgsC/CapC [Actinomycetospora cinnamomea]